MSTPVNKFKRTSVAGQFTNVDLPAGTDNAHASFQRDIDVGGDIHLGTETVIDEVYTNTGGNICFNINGVAYSITPTMLSHLVSLTDNLAKKTDITYVDDKIAQIVDSSPATLDTLNELAAALGDDPNFATTVSNSIGLKADKTYTDTQLGLKDDIVSVNSKLTTKANLNNPVFTGSVSVPSIYPTSVFIPQSAGSVYFYSGSASNLGSRFSYSASNAMFWDNYHPTNIQFRYGATPVAKQTFFNNGDVSITGSILNCPTITTINTQLALKSDKTYVDTQLASKDDIASVDSKLLLKSDLTFVNSALSALNNEFQYYDDEIQGIQNQIATISLTPGPAGPAGIAGPQGPPGIPGTTGNFDSSSDISCANINVSGTITNTALTSVLNSKANLSLVSDALDLKLNKMGDTLNTVTLTGTTYFNGNVYQNANAGFYWYLNDISAYSSRLILAGYNAMIWDNPTATDIRFRWGATNIQRHTFSSNGALAIAGNFNAVNGNFTGPITSPTITTINSSITTINSNISDQQAAIDSKADTSAVNSALALKANTASPTFTGTTTIGDLNHTGTIFSPALQTILNNYALNSALSTKVNTNSASSISSYLHFGNHAQAYTGFSSQNFGAISCNKGGGGHAEMNFIQNGSVPGATLRAFNFMLATSNTSFTELMKINKNGDMVVTGTVSSPNITDINTSITTINTNKANIASPTFSGTAVIPTSNVNTINCSNQLYFYSTARGTAEPSSRLHYTPANDSMYWDNPISPSIIWRWSTSYTAKQIFYPNGDVSIPGSILNCPTITAINSSIALKADTTSVNSKLSLKDDITSVNSKLALKDDITSVNSKLLLKDDITSVNSKLTNYALLASSPTFTGNVKSQIYTGGVVRHTAAEHIYYTPSTLPSVIIKNTPSTDAAYSIPDMPIGTKFTVIKFAHFVSLYSSASGVFFYTSRLSDTWGSSITVYEDSRTFIRAEIQSPVTNQVLQVWLTESSHTYDQEEKIVKSMVGAYMLDGPDYGTIATTYRPIICSTRVFGPGNSDDGYIVNPGFALVTYSNENYGGNATTYANIFPVPKHFPASSVNDMQSCKLYFNGLEILIGGVSYAL